MALSVGVFNVFFPAGYLTGEPQLNGQSHEMLTTKGV